MTTSAGPISILVVEDNEGDFFLLQNAILESGIKVGKLQCADRLASAAALLNKERFDIIFLDLSLPDSDGMETFGQFREHAGDTPIVVLSGISSGAIALKTIKQGAQDYLMKDSLDAATLQKTIYYSIERGRNIERLHFQATILENITDSVIVTDLDQKVRFWNRAATEVFGYDESEMIGKDIDILHIDKNDGTDLRTLQRELDRKGWFVASVRRKTKESRIIWIELKVTYNYDVNKNINGLIRVSKDITAIRAEEHLLKLFQSVIINAYDAVIITEAQPTADGTRKIVFVNEAFTKGTGYSPGEVIGKNIFLLAGPMTDQHELRRIQENLNHWQSFTSEIAYYKKDGSLFWVNVTVMPISDDQGHYTHWVFIQRDVTSFRESAEKLKKQNDELTKTNLELDRFVYSASHDLRAPLTSVLGLVGLMRKEPFAPQAGIFIDRIQESVQRLDRLIQNIINYSRNSRLSLKREPVAFGELFDTAVSMHKFMDNSHLIRFEFVNKIAQPFVSDPERWQIIFNNLVSNSIKFAQQSNDAFIRVTVREENKNLVLEFYDNGIGIPKDQKDLVFQMFYRANHKAEGSGLGLYIVKQTVGLLGGTIEVESEPGKFTCFLITAPFNPGI